MKRVEFSQQMTGREVALMICIRKQMYHQKRHETKTNLFYTILILLNILYVKEKHGSHNDFFYNVHLFGVRREDVSQ
jgi:hypothetical protein